MEETNITSDGAVPAEKLFQRSTSFATVYANNVQFDTTVFDLSILFGYFVREHGVYHVEQHTSVTMAWTEAKLAAMLLLVNVFIHEEAHGPIPIPNVVRPGFVPEEDATSSAEQIIMGLIHRNDERRQAADRELGQDGATSEE